MNYPVTCDLLIARQLLIIQNTDKEIIIFKKNCAQSKHTLNSEAIQDHLQDYNHKIKMALTFIINRAKTVSCRKSLEFAIARLEDMENAAVRD